MKTTEAFKQVIKENLDKRAKEDELFAVSYAKENKNIDGCISYILNTVQQSGCNGFADEEIYSMAVHYYDEDNLTVGKAPNCHIVINHTVELTEEDKKQARDAAMKKLQEEQYTAMKKKPKKQKPEAEDVKQMSLF